MSFRHAIASFSAVLAAFTFVSCEESQQAQGLAFPDGNGLSLVDPWDASRYCGPVMPEIPANPTPPHRFETTFLDGKLGDVGLTGWMHGVVPVYQQYVFTYRKEDPNDFMAFFKAEQFSLVPATPDVAAVLPTLKRHDKVRLKGKVFQNGSPLTHVRVTSIEILQKYPLATDNSYAVDTSRFAQMERFDVFGQIHAIASSDKLGHALVVEYKDMMLPIAILPQHASIVPSLYRGDIINISVQLVQRGRGPAHFQTDDQKAAAIEVVDPMLHCHNQERVVEGHLVKFEKSPAISTDVYAVRVVDANGIARNYTFFPDTEDQDKFMEIFMGVSAKSKAAWEASAQAPAVVRNFREKTTLKVRAKGRINVVSSEQANAQVYLTSADDLEIVAVENP